MNYALVFLLIKCFVPKFVAWEILKNAYEEVLYKIIKTVGSRNPQICFIKSAQYNNDELLMDACKYVDLRVRENTRTLCATRNVHAIGTYYEKMFEYAMWTFLDTPFFAKLVCRGYINDLEFIKRLQLFGQFITRIENPTIEKLRLCLVIYYTKKKHEIFKSLSETVGFETTRKYLRYYGYDYLFVCAQDKEKLKILLSDYLSGPPNSNGLAYIIRNSHKYILWLKTDKKPRVDVSFLGKYLVDAVDEGTIYWVLKKIESAVY